MSTSTDTLARGLGLASLLLGVPQVAAPDRFAEAVGVEPRAGTRDLTVGVGLRELTAAAGLLLRGSSPTFLWSRVAGDVMDLALLSGALRHGGPGRGRTVAATVAVAGIAALDLGAARRASIGRSPSGRELELTAAVTVAKPPEEVYDFWRGLERLPAFMWHLESVEWTAEGRTRWTAKAPLGRTVTWDAELVEDVRGEVIAWRSLPGADVDNSGSVRFSPAPAGRGTEVRVHLRYAVPGGRLGATVARLLGEEPHQQVEDDLRRCKQVLETGEVVRSDGTPEGSVARHHALQSAAVPSGRTLGRPRTDRRSP